MSRILVTGGRGGFGREVVARLKQGGHTVQVMSRSQPRAGENTGVEWAQADLETGAGIAEAVKDVDIIVNSASNPVKNTFAVDVVGTKAMLELARSANVRHVIHISIVGIERIPNTYYRAKVAAEQVIQESGVPYSILRATQFHTLLDWRLSGLKQMRWSPFFLLPTDYQFQLIETGEVADYLLPYTTEQAHGYIPEIGGPEVLTLGQIARMWLEVQGMKKPIFRLPTFGKVAEGFRKGYNTCPERKQGSITWADYLQGKYGSASEKNAPMARGMTA